MIESFNIPGFEQRVRDRAYALWEREGRPFGRDADHWRRSEEATRAELAEPAPARKTAKAKTPARRKPAPKRAASAELSAAL